MTIYEKFRSSSLDLSVLGLHDGSSVSESKLTPNHTRVLAWLNASAVHFCQFPEHGDIVFAVDPNALPEEQILPVAENIPHFIGLLIRCKDAALIAGAYQWSSFRFQELVDAVTPGMKARSVIRALENIYHPPMIQDPGAVLSRLRMEFAGSFGTANWGVGFGTDFSHNCPKGRCGKELVLNRSLSHSQGTWHVPSIFLCEDGVVVDTFLEVSPDQLLDFRNNWDGRREESLSLIDKLQRQLDHPLSAAVSGILFVNDKPIQCKCSFTAVWNPMCDNAASVRGILNHYRLDPDQGYLFIRYCFLRKGKQPQIRTLQLTLEATPIMIPGETFTVQKAGMRLRFTHPGTGLEHSFTALALNDEALNPNFLTNHPCHFTRLTYALEPSISPDNFQIADTDPGDWWEGHQDDPATVIYAGKKPDPGRYALSSLRYEACDQIRWQMIFRRKPHQDLQLKLLP